MDMFLSEYLNTDHEMSRHGDFFQHKWVDSRLPRAPASTGDVQEVKRVRAVCPQVDPAGAGICWNLLAASRAQAQAQTRCNGDGANLKSPRATVPPQIQNLASVPLASS